MSVTLTTWIGHYGKKVDVFTTADKARAAVGSMAVGFGYDSPCGSVSGDFSRRGKHIGVWRIEPHMTVAAPTYAADGSRGFQVAGDGIVGWVDRAEDGRAIATLNSSGWQYISVNPVSDADWSEVWVSENVRSALIAFGYVR